MQLDTVEAGSLGIFGTFAELFDDARKLVQRQRAWRYHLLRPLGGEHLALRGYGRRCHRELAAMKVRMGNTPDMPELQRSCRRHDARLR